MKIYLFRLAVGLMTFIFAVVIFNGGRFIKQQFDAPTPASKVKESFPVAQFSRLDSEIAEQIKIAGTETEAEPQWRWDGSGEFYFDGETLPKGFKDFEFLEIVTRDYEVQNETGAYGAPIPPEGFIQAGKKFKFTRIGIGNKQVAFETETVGGISYKFTGDLKDEDSDSCDIEQGAADLKGRLIKMKNGKKIAETEIGFNVSCGC